MLPQSHRQEALSRAYVRAIAAQAGVTCGDVYQDYGIDIYLRGIEVVDGEYRDTGPQIDLQLRTATQAVIREDEIAYDLEVRTYNRLRLEQVFRPCYFVLLVLPEEESLWLTQSIDELILRRCAFGTSLRGAEPTTNQRTIRIQIPKTELFSVETVLRWMDEARREARS